MSDVGDRFFEGGTMRTKVGTPCRFCGTSNVYHHVSTAGKVYYQCDNCYEKWE
jgi:hypothetical protein